MAKLRPMMMIPPVIFVAVAGLFLGGMFHGQGEELPSALEGQAAAPVPETAFPGTPGFTAEDLRDGEVKLVNFWASWCAPCRVEHPHLMALAERGIPVYGVNYKDSAANAAAFLEELGSPYAALVADQNGRGALEWGVYGVPETYVIAGDGTILGRMAGPVTGRSIAQRLAPMLEKAGVNIDLPVDMAPH